MGLIFRTRNENIYDYIYQADIIGVYGSERNIPLTDDKLVFYIDRRAEQINSIDGKPVVTHKKFEEIIKEKYSDANIVILIMFANKPHLNNSIYSDLVQLDINGSVFEYYTNYHIFTQKDFYFAGNLYPLFEHSFNCGYYQGLMTERSIELSIATDWIEKHDNIIEIGAVTPYYINSPHIRMIVDPTDKHRAVTHQSSLFELQLKEQNVLSISTVEHIGTGDYGFHEAKSSIDALNKIRKEAASYLITVPLGYNPLLDCWISDNLNQPDIYVLVREIGNCWKELDLSQGLPEILYGPWANGLAIITN